MSAKKRKQAMPTEKQILALYLRVRWCDKHERRISDYVESKAAGRPVQITKTKYQNIVAMADVVSKLVDRVKNGEITFEYAWHVATRYRDDIAKSHGR